MIDYKNEKNMNFDFPTRRTNPLIEHFLSHAIHHNAPNSMKLGNYDSDDDDMKPERFEHIKLY